jgi:cytochrome b
MMMSEFWTVVLIAFAIHGVVAMHKRNKRSEIVEMMYGVKSRLDVPHWPRLASVSKYK